jgi:hypothetical protein
MSPLRRLLILPILPLLAILSMVAAATASPLVGAGLPGSRILTVHGTVLALDRAELTVRAAGPRLGVIAALSRAADTVAAGEYPYVWGGGHALAGVADTGMRGGPGANGRRIGFDCSGAVAAVLAGAGLWAPGTGVPSDAGVIAQLRAAHLIVPGPGRGADGVTLWDERGVHIFMEIGARFFGTSDGAAPSPANPHGGAGWLDDGAPDTHDHRFRPWHLVPSALQRTVQAAGFVTVALPAGIAAQTRALVPGSRIGVQYAMGRAGLVALDIATL